MGSLSTRIGIIRDRQAQVGAVALGPMRPWLRLIWEFKVRGPNIDSK